MPTQQQQQHLQAHSLNLQQQPVLNQNHLDQSNLSNGIGNGMLSGSGGGMIMNQNGYSTNTTAIGNQSQLISSPKIEDFKMENNNMSSKEPGQTYRGFIAVIKENFGFIETLSHDEEVFFHFSNYVGNPNWLELGQEVEYTLSPNGNTSVSGNCLPAENVRTLPKGSIPQPAVLDATHNGIGK